MTNQPFEVGDPLPEIRLRITAEAIDAFAEVANDHSRMHFDDTFARMRGFPAAIAHGAIAASTFPALLERVFGGWPRAGEQLKVTFIGAAFRGDEVVTSGRVAAVDGETAVLELWCMAGERKLAVAEATVSLEIDRMADIRKGSVCNSKRPS